MDNRIGYAADRFRRADAESSAVPRHIRGLGAYASGSSPVGAAGDTPSPSQSWRPPSVATPGGSVPLKRSASVAPPAVRGRGSGGDPGMNGVEPSAVRVPVPVGGVDAPDANPSWMERCARVTVGVREPSGNDGPTAPSGTMAGTTPRAASAPDRDAGVAAPGDRTRCKSGNDPDLVSDADVALPPPAVWVARRPTVAALPGGVPFDGCPDVAARDKNAGGGREADINSAGGLLSGA